MKTYACLISQTGTEPPQVVILKNELGQPVVWTTFSDGAYRATAPGAFPAGKVGHLGSVDCFNGSGMAFVTGREGNDSMRAVNLDDEGNPHEIGSPAENYVEFRVYP